MIAALFSALWSAACWLLSTLLSLLSWATSWLLNPLVVAVLVLVVGGVYHYLTRYYDFWPSRGVPGPTPKLPFGMDYKKNKIESGSIIMLDSWLYNQCGGKRYCGWIEMTRPVLTVGDLDLIRAITIKDFEHFTDRRDLITSEIFREMLSVVNGKVWKETRAVMSPTFSSSKLKAMHQLCLDNASNLGKYLLQEMEEHGEVELKDAFGRFTMDNIASCAFGVNCNSFVDPNTEFARHAGNFLKPFKGYALFRIIALLLLPEWIALKLPDPNEASSDFFIRAVNRTIRHRESSGTSRKDYLQLLLDSRDKDGHRILTNSSIVSQAVLFFVAGYDTTATLLTFAAYSLATSPDCQQAAQREIDDVLEKHGGQLTYEAVAEMAYVDRVLSETLRLYSPAIRLERQCSKDYTLPGTSVRIPRGLLIQVPVLAIHRDPDIYPDPLRFDPDRFLPEEKEKRHPCAFIPFGSGPRNCIAMRFALFEAKVALVAVLRDSTLKPGPRTPPPPMPLDLSAFLTRPKDGAFLKVEPRNR